MRFLHDGLALEFSSAEVNPLKLEWNYAQGMAFDPATFEATLYGIGQEDRAKAARKGAIVELFAGYESTGMPLHYRGSIYWSMPVVAGADWGVKVYSAGGCSSRAVINVAAGTSHDAVLTAILEAYSQTTGLEIKRGAIEAPSGSVPQRRVLRGSIDDLLRAWALEHGLEVDVVNGTAQAVAVGGDTGEMYVLVSPDTGIEGGPEQIMAGFGGMIFTPRGVRFQCRLNPNIRIGRKVKVQHRLIPGGSGFYTVRRVTSQGDTRGQAWTMGIEATGPVRG